MNILDGDGDFLPQLLFVALDPREFVHEALVENPVDFRAAGQFCSVDFWAGSFNVLLKVNTEWLNHPGGESGESGGEGNDVLY